MEASAPKEPEERFPDIRALAAAHAAEQSVIQVIQAPQRSDPPPESRLDDNTPTAPFVRQDVSRSEPLTISDRAFMGLMTSCGAPMKEILSGLEKLRRQELERRKAAD